MKPSTLKQLPPSFLKELNKVRDQGAVSGKELLKEISRILLPPEDTSLTTASFKIHPAKLDTLKNIVHTKKEMGHTTYTQTQALHEAIDLLSQTLSVKDRGKKQKYEEGVRSIIISRGVKKRQQEGSTGVA